MRSSLFLLILTIISANLFSEETVINSAGKKILLKDDNTWVVVNDTPTQSKDFRNAIWGMDKETVKSNEKSSLKYDQDNILVYSDSISGFSCDVVYIFAKQKLVRAKYIFTDDHSNQTDFIDDYKAMTNLLNKKYGTPNDTQVIWKNDLYKSDPSNWGMALVLGQLKYFTIWKNANTTILLYLSGENFKATFGIEYSSISLSSLENQVQTEEAAEKL